MRLLTPTLRLMFLTPMSLRNRPLQYLTLRPSLAICDSAQSTQQSSPQNASASTAATTDKSVVAATADKSAAVVTEPRHVATSSASGVDVPSQPSQGANDKSLSTPATGNIVSDVVPPGKPDVDKDISNATQQVGCAC